MEDEEGYTTLNLQSRTPVSARGHLGNNKGIPAPSPMWHPVALILLTLCLVLFIGLVALLVMLFQAPTASGDGTESLTLDKEDLQAVINNMPMRLREIRESLCLKGEEQNKNNGPNCILCPANWQWMGGDTCFYISEVKRSWEESQKFCSSQNSTLFMLKDKDKLVWS
ncbi:C-type lectin domain family 1 member A-like [Emydura macquarii macquarii]|uniref:C-type lectin domain family 1 member A-like n=1 Tax=Emydura macquarii macquarii TaxID=1129001 RepID=UPI00352A6D88